MGSLRAKQRTLQSRRSRSERLVALLAGRLSRKLRHPDLEQVGVIPIALDGDWHRTRVTPHDPAWIEAVEYVVPVTQRWTEAKVQVEVPPAPSRVRGRRCRKSVSSSGMLTSTMSARPSAQDRDRVCGHRNAGFESIP